VLLELKKIVDLLALDQVVPANYKDHELLGKYKGIRELHLFPDDLLMYFKIEDNELVLVAIGSHSDLFG
jgi:mRNA interferase YafQ